MDGVALLRVGLGRYGAVWVLAFLASGAGILLAMAWLDLMAAADLVLPPLLLAVSLALVAGAVLGLRARAPLGAKVALVALAVLLWLPLMWAPVSAAGVIAWVADRPIEYSAAYSAFRIGVGRVLWPLEQALFGSGFAGWLWGAFQALASVVGFCSALANIWPIVRRALEAGPAVAGRE